jgi:hypothetical protein
VRFPGLGPGLSHLGLSAPGTRRGGEGRNAREVAGRDETPGTGRGWNGLKARPVEARGEAPGMRRGHTGLKARHGTARGEAPGRRSHPNRFRPEGAGRGMGGDDWVGLSGLHHHGRMGFPGLRPGLSHEGLSAPSTRRGHAGRNAREVAGRGEAPGPGTGGSQRFGTRLLRALEVVSRRARRAASAERFAGNRKECVRIRDSGFTPPNHRRWAGVGRRAGWRSRCRSGRR